jgi:asparagine synthase (glutamine-hydrolysing)
VPYWLGRHVLPAAPQFLARLLPAGLSYRSQRAAKVLRDSALPLEQGYRDKTTIWSQSEICELLPGDLVRQSGLLSDQYLPDPLWNVLRSPRDLISRLTEIDLRSYLLDDILVKVDRMSMSQSLEVRSPLLDHKLVEFAASLPVALKLRGWQPKAILRDVLRRHLPPRTLAKRKQGFSVPLRDWFRNGLAEMVGDYLDSAHGRLPAELFAPEKVASVLREHRRGAVDHSRKIWLMMMFAAWHDTYQGGRELAHEAARCGALA